MSADSDPQPIQLSARLAWVGLEDTPMLFANQFIGQVDDHGDVIITFGQANPPVILGSPEEQAEQAANLAFIQVRPVARLALGRDRIKDVITALQQTLDNQLAQKNRSEPT